MNCDKMILGLCCALVLAMGGCSRQQSDWQKTRELNTTDSYEQFLKKYPSGEFSGQASARVKELYEERDWQKARDADTAEAYQAFLKQYPEGKWTEEARIRVENFTLAQAPSGTGTSTGSDSGGAPGSAGSDAPNVVAPSSVRPESKTAPATGPTSKPVAPPHAAPPPPKAATKAAGSYGIQLGAFKSGADPAHARWAALQKEFPSLLSGMTAKVASKKTASGTLYRLQATGLTEKRARDVCNALKAKSQACVVVAPGQG